MSGTDRNKKSLTFPYVEIVRASAGSGKTYALAKRYVELLMDKELAKEEKPLRSILAITFTNKAAIEMKERIFLFLKEITLDNLEKEGQRAKGIENSGKKAAKFVDDILADYDHFQVETIDSFMNTLITSCALQLGISSSTRIREDHRAYIEYSLDELLDRSTSDRNTKKAFLDLLDYYLYVEKKEGWFSKKDILELVEVLYGFLNIYGKEFKSENVKFSKIRAKKEAVFEKIEKLSLLADEGTHASFLKALKKFVDEKNIYFKVEDLSKYFTREEYPAKKNFGMPASMPKLWESLRKDLAAIAVIESTSVFGPYIDIFNRVREGFAGLALDDDVIFLPELNVYAQKLAADTSFTVAEIYYRLAARIKHYLLDEFQDTSELQWKNVKNMAEEALSSGGSLFAVGDRKQAIFGFRGGASGLFETVKDDLSALGPFETFLDKNYRSREKIVKFNNAIFSEENLRRFIAALPDISDNISALSENDTERVLSVFRGAEQAPERKASGGFVVKEFIPSVPGEEKEDIIKNKILDLVKRTAKRVPSSSIAVLARSNRDVETVSSWFLESGVPVETEKTLNMREHPLINEILSFLAFLDSPMDDLMFAAFLLGDIFTKTAGFDRKEIEGFIFDARNKKTGKERTLYGAFRQRYPDIWKTYIDEFFKTVGHVPLYELLVTIFGKYDVLNNFSGYQGFFMKLLEVVKENEEEYHGIGSFFEMLKTMDDRHFFVHIGTKADAVKVLTIHKAKGLEFPVVIMPFFEIDVAVGSGAGGRKKPYVIRENNEGTIELVQLKKEYNAYSAPLRAEYEKEYADALIEELSVMYVAMTRARDELYVFVPEKSSNRKNIAEVLFEEQNFTIGEPTERVAAQEASDNISIPVSKYSDWIDFLKDDAAEITALTNKDNIKRGDVMHLILSFAGNLSEVSPEDVIRKAASRVALEHPNFKETDSFILKAEKILSEEKLKDIFYVPGGKVYTEKDIVDEKGNTKRLDRLIVREKDVWVVDYKSSADAPAKHKEQVEGYKRLVRAIYPNKLVRGFLLYLDSVSVVEV
ncbi:MAG: UvrD-helicase domain-containing protein [Candidatus Omnitrophica bacterium]|nr:UvrD-helicase domain-containing protein [Candidatus Omnitrophota bacterium]